MDIDVTLTKGQYIKLQWLLVIARANSFYKFYFYLLITFLIFSLIPGLLIQNIRTIVTAFLFFLFIVASYTLIQVIQALLKSNKIIFVKNHYTINENGIINKSSSSEDVYKWQAFLKWKKIPGYYILFTSSMLFIVLPVKDIPDCEIANLEDLFEREIGTNKTSKRTKQNILLLITVLLLIFIWGLTILASYYLGNGVLSEISTFSLILWIAVPILAIIIPFYLLRFYKKTVSKTKAVSLTVLLWCDVVCMFVILFDIYLSQSFMY
jgi:hypothetical protein